MSEAITMRRVLRCWAQNSCYLLLPISPCWRAFDMSNKYYLHTYYSVQEFLLCGNSVTLNTTGRETPYFLLTSDLEHGPLRHAAANK